jgi:hypothetical protein
MTLVLMSSLILTVAIVADLGHIVNKKIELQSSADAGAMAGASAMADTMNALAIGNWMVIATTAANVASLGKLTPTLNAMDTAQEALINAGPSLAVGVAKATAKSTGGDYSYPLIRAANGKFSLPSLMVAREAKIWALLRLGSSGKVTVDKAQPVKNRPYGDRYILLASQHSKKPTIFGGSIPIFKLNTPRSVSIAQTAVEGGRLWGWPGPWPGFRAKFVPISDSYNGSVLRH